MLPDRYISSEKTISRMHAQVCLRAAWPLITQDTPTSKSHPRVAFYSGEDRMTRQEIRKSIIACAAELKHVPSLEELLKMTPVSHRQIIKHFGGYIAALRDTGLELKSAIGRGHGVPLEKLFTDWAGVVQKLKKLPSINEYTLLSQYSPYPLMRRFGKWLQVPHGLKQFAEKCGLAEEWKAELELVPAPPAACANGLVKPCL